MGSNTDSTYRSIGTDRKSRTCPERVRARSYLAFIKVGGSLFPLDALRLVIGVLLLLFGLVSSRQVTLCQVFRDYLCATFFECSSMYSPIVMWEASSARPPK